MGAEQQLWWLFGRWLLCIRRLSGSVGLPESRDVFPVFLRHLGECVPGFNNTSSGGGRFCDLQRPRGRAFAPIQMICFFTAAGYWGNDTIRRPNLAFVGRGNAM